MRTKILLVAMVCFAALAFDLWADDSPPQTTFSVHPGQIRIGADFNGDTVTVTGRIPADATAMIRITGQPETCKLKEKGRVLGILWMNLGSVEIRKVPSVFLTYLPEGPHDPWLADKLQTLGLQGLRRQAEILPADKQQDSVFEEFLKLKRKGGLYSAVDQAIVLGPADGSTRSVSASLALPAALPAGHFVVELISLRKDAEPIAANQQITVSEVGMPAWISNLAFKHGTLYGVLSVLVAVIAGLMTGIVFKGGKGSH